MFRDAERPYVTILHHTLLNSISAFICTAESRVISSICNNGPTIVFILQRSEIYVSDSLNLKHNSKHCLFLSIIYKKLFGKDKVGTGMSL